MVLNIYTLGLLFLSGKKNNIIIINIILKKPLYLIYCNVSRPFTLSNIEITLLYFIVHVFLCIVGLFVRKSSIHIINYNV